MDISLDSTQREIRELIEVRRTLSPYGNFQIRGRNYGPFNTDDEIVTEIMDDLSRRDRTRIERGPSGLVLQTTSNSQDDVVWIDSSNREEVMNTLRSDRSIWQCTGGTIAVPRRVYTYPKPSQPAEPTGLLTRLTIIKNDTKGA